MGVGTRWMATVAVAAGLLAAPMAGAQGLFAPAASVDGTAITNFQVDQRAGFLTLLNAPDVTREGARDALIDETIQLRAARAAGIEIPAEELDAAMVEFAGRANLEPEQFIAVLEQRGIAGETFRDFIRNGLYWRALVRERFGPRSRPSEAEIDRAAASGAFDLTVEGGATAQLSEIAIPLAGQADPATQRRLAENLAGSLRGEDAFARAAQRYSAAPTAARGGRIGDAVPLANLPPDAAAAILAAAPGTVVGPFDFGSFLALFLVREIKPGAGAAARTLSVDYATYPVADAAAVAGLRARVDACDDLYGVALRAGRSAALVRETVAVDALPADIRAAIATLDDREIGILPAQGGVRALMLCGRVREVPEGALDQIGGALFQNRISTYAQGYLDELKADAVVERF